MGAANRIKVAIALVAVAAWILGDALERVQDAALIEAAERQMR